MRICGVEGCGKATKARALCEAHYRKVLRSENPEKTREDGRKNYLKHKKSIVAAVRLFHKAAKHDPETFLRRLHYQLAARTRGLWKHNRRYYRHLPVCERREFVETYRGNTEFLRKFRSWVTSGNQRALTPVAGRIISDAGYTVKNIEWITYSEAQSRSYERRVA